MKILVVSQHYYPENFRITDVCETLVKRGHQVDVICGLPNYPEGEVLADYKHKQNREQVINGVNIHRAFEIGRGHNSIKLFLNYYSVCLSMKKKAKKIKKDFDLVLINQLSPVMVAWAGIAYAKKHKVPCLLYCLDLWPESLKHAFNNKENFVFKYYKKVSSKIYSKVDMIATTTRSFEDYLKPLIKKEPNIVYLPQYGEDDYIVEPINKVDNNIIDFVFAGNMGKVQDLDIIVKAVNEIKDNNKFLVHLVGNGSMFNDIKQMVEELKLENKIILHGRKSAKEVREYYELADALLITLQGVNAVGDTLPGKMQTYLTVGKPIFGAINGGGYEVIKESQSGDCVHAADYKGLSKIMLDFIENQDKYADCGNNAISYFQQNFTKEKFFISLEKIFEELINNK